MILRRFKETQLKPSDITSEALFLNRREFIGSLLSMSLVSSPLMHIGSLAAQEGIHLEDQLTPIRSVMGYNNYYEFSTNKEAVRTLAQQLKIDPWSITLEGEVETPITLDADQISQLAPSEERIYRLRCVEGWSMVVPWLGFPLSKLLEKAKPLSSAKYVEFESVYRPDEMIGQRRGTLSWPYREALRIDEANHPLTLLVTGLYGKPLPKQNGAPFRLAIPWKYGYKSIKAISKIRFLKERPVTSWMQAVPSEYGFYANVNPSIPHPRWSQKREVRLGETRKQRTLMLNGYADEVAYLYKEKGLNTYL
ncbi:MAG: sulfoxide reductase catalytic subunit YedY [Oleispira sp.]